MSINDLRRSQIVVPFGPGAIYDYKDYSAMTMEVDTWDYFNEHGEHHEIKNNRFLKFINKKMRFYEGPNYKKIYRLMHPPIALDRNQSEEIRYQMGTISVKKFPMWGLCSRCNALSRFDTMKIGSKCNSKNVEPRRRNTKFQPCANIKNKGKIEPVRFIAYCSSGHIEDLPWTKIMRLKCNDACQMDNQSHSPENPILFLSDDTLGNGFASLVIECGICNESTNLAKLGKNSDKYIDEHGLNILQCSGSKPWSISENDDCNNILNIEPRAASKIYNSIQLTSIYVPEPENITHEFILDPTVQGWLMDNTLISSIETTLDTMKSYFEKFKLSNQQMLDMIQEERDLLKSEVDDDDDDDDFLESEYLTLCKKQVDDKKFVSKTIPLNNYDSLIADKFTSLTQIKKLYSSVALLGFRRLGASINNNVNEQDYFNPSRRNANFIPGFETIGEGIFINFGYENIQKWLSKNKGFKVKEKQLKESASKNIYIGHKESESSYGYVMMHTFTHALMNQLSIECGYTITDLKERIYFCDSKKMGGVLIYTASADSAGSLGGLVRMIKPKYFESLVKNAITNSRFCSNDPICRESNGQGYSGLCMAACYACSMIPDLACCSSPRNSFLDRNALIGDDTNAKGYFSNY